MAIRLAFDDNAIADLRARRRPRRPAVTREHFIARLRGMSPDRIVVINQKEAKS